MNKSIGQSTEKSQKCLSRLARKTSQQYKRFNYIFLSLASIPVLVLGIINAFIDPYSVLKSPKISRLNESKPEMLSHVRLYKAFDIIELKPEVILLGNSRAEWGLDPEHLLFREYQAYNLGFSGANMNEVWDYFSHALANEKGLKKVVLALDFIMFNQESANADPSAAKILGKTQTDFQDYINFIFSFDALNSSYKTLEKNLYRHYPDHRVKKGKAILDPRRDVPGSSDNFTQWIRAGIKSYPNYRIAIDKLEHLQKLVEICQQNNIELKVFISPVHATQLEAIRVSGQWATYEDWKRKLVNITPLWDFSGYNSVTTEPVSDRMNDYIDSSHYQENVGNLILERLFNQTDSHYPTDFGVYLTPTNLESHLLNLRNAQSQWIQTHPEEVNLVQDVKKTPYKRLGKEGRIF